MWSILYFLLIIYWQSWTFSRWIKNLLENRIWLSACRWAGPKDFFHNSHVQIFFSILEWHKLDSMKRRYGPYHWTESKSLSSSWNNPLDLNYIWRNIMDSTGGLYTTSTVHFLVSFCQPLKKSKRATKRLSWGGWRLVEQCPLLIQLQKKGRLEGGKKFSPYLFFWS